MEDQLIYQLALAHIRGIGSVAARKLVDVCGDAKSVFVASGAQLKQAGLRGSLIDSIRNFRDFSGLQPELRYLARNDIRVLFYKDPDYPRRLLLLPETPALLYYQGNADVNAARVIAIAGTRKPSPYGIQVVQQLIRELACPDLLIVSGLAFGIDAEAHATALKCGIPTIGVLGSGVTNVQPREHWGLARKMRQQGGVMSSFRCDAGGATHSFPVRNKLIAGLCDALIVIESGIPGGSLSTAGAAFAFRKNCFAVPGRLSDEKSQGCLKLIHERTALPLLSAGQICAVMGWQYPADRPSHQPSLPFIAAGDQPGVPLAPSGCSEQNATAPDPPSDGPPHSATEQQLLDMLREGENLSLDELQTMSRLGIPALYCSLLDLELRGFIRSLPGKRYNLVNR